MNELIRFDNVTFSWPDRSLFQNLSFSVPEGEFLVILGPNGGGKSTLIQLLLGFLHPQSGTIQVLGQAPGMCQSIGYVPQNIAAGEILPISVEAATLMGCLRPETRNWTQEDRQAALEVLARLELTSLRQKRLQELSLGQRQKVMIARALVSRPRLLILDEPLSSVDPSARQSILNALKEVSRDCSVMMVSHDLSVIPGCATSIACVDGGFHYHHGSDLTPAVLRRLRISCPVEAAEEMQAELKKQALTGFCTDSSKEGHRCSKC